jgi:hypothetical protein
VKDMNLLPITATAVLIDYRNKDGLKIVAKALLEKAPTINGSPSVWKVV